MKHEMSKKRISELKESFLQWRNDYDQIEDAPQYLTFSEAMIAMDMLLAGMEQEPAATVFKSGDSAKVIMIGADLADGYTDLFAQAAPVVSEQPAPVVKPVSLLMVIFHPRMPINWRKYCRILMPKNR